MRAIIFIRTPGWSRKKFSQRALISLLCFRLYDFLRASKSSSRIWGNYNRNEIIGEAFVPQQHFDSFSLSIKGTSRRNVNWKAPQTNGIWEKRWVLQRQSDASMIWFRKASQVLSLPKCCKLRGFEILETLLGNATCGKTHSGSPRMFFSWLKNLSFFRVLVAQMESQLLMHLENSISFRSKFLHEALWMAKVRKCSTIVPRVLPDLVALVKTFQASWSHKSLNRI